MCCACGGGSGGEIEPTITDFTGDTDKTLGDGQTTGIFVEYDCDAAAAAAAAA